MNDSAWSHNRALPFTMVSEAVEKRGYSQKTPVHDLVNRMKLSEASHSCNGFGDAIPCRPVSSEGSAPTDAKLLVLRGLIDPSPSSDRQQWLPCHRSIAVLRQLLLGLGIDVRLPLCLRKMSPSDLLALIVRLTLHLSPFLKPVTQTESVLKLGISARRHLGCQPTKPWQPNGGQDISIVTNLSTTSLYFQPTSWLSLPTVQYFLPGFNLKTRRAWGTTILFFLSYGGGTPSKTLSRSMAAAPRAVLCGIIPRTVL